MIIYTISQSLNPGLVVALGLVSVNRPEGVSTAAKVAWYVLFWVRHYRQGRQIESLDDCVAGDDVDRVEVTAPIRRRRVGRAQALRPQGAGLTPHSD